MKRRGYISPRIETMENYEAAFRGFAKGKEHRDNVRRFAADLEANLMELLAEYRDSTGHTSEYQDEEIFEPKRRTVSKLPVRDHVRQWAPLLQTERLFTDTFIRRSCSCVKGARHARLRKPPAQGTLCRPCRYMVFRPARRTPFLPQHRPFSPEGQD